MRLEISIPCSLSAYSCWFIHSVFFGRFYFLGHSCRVFQFYHLASWSACISEWSLAIVVRMWSASISIHRLWAFDFEEFVSKWWWSVPLDGFTLVISISFGIIKICGEVTGICKLYNKWQVWAHLYRKCQMESFSISLQIFSSNYFYCYYLSWFLINLANTICHPIPKKNMFIKSLGLFSV